MKTKTRKELPPDVAERIRERLNAAKRQRDRNARARRATVKAEKERKWREFWDQHAAEMAAKREGGNGQPPR